MRRTQANNASTNGGWAGADGLAAAGEPNTEASGVDTTATRCRVGGVAGEVCADVIGAGADLLDVTSGAGGVGADSAGAATEGLGVTVLWRSTSVPGGRSSPSVDDVAFNADI
ncbi:hypothetical protein A5633_17410 [Mycolicibacterium elephantis]|nr:hypothetical protein A5633_17410 [Mycolicibacterium elephantis]